VATYAAYLKAAMGVVSGQPQAITTANNSCYQWPHGSASDNYTMVVGFNFMDEDSCKKFAEKINKLREEIGGRGIIAYSHKNTLTVCLDPDHHSDLERAINREVENYCNANPSKTLSDSNARYLWDLFHRGSY